MTLPFRIHCPHLALKIVQISVTGTLFFVYITSPNPSLNSHVTLRYYSAVLKNIFYGDVAFPFCNGDRQGTVNNPLRPLFRAEE